MKQTKKGSLSESIVQTIVGLVMGLVIQMVMYPIFDIETNFTQNLLITSIFSAFSMLKSYLIRRCFATF